MKSKKATSKPKAKARKTYERAAPACTARDLGWDGVRPVTMPELLRLAGVGYFQLRRDRVEHEILGAPLPKQKGVRVPIWSAATARRYLRQKNPRALIFS